MTDLEFVRRCSSGDKPSWNLFIEKYSRLIFTYIHHTLQLQSYTYDKETVQELFQEIITHLYKDNFAKLKTFKAKNSCTFASWLRQVTIHRVIDYVRRQCVSLSLDEDKEDGFSLGQTIADPAVSARETASLKEQYSVLTECISLLTVDEKFFVRMHFNKKVRLESLRQILKLTRSAIDMRKARIIEKLKQCFKAKGVM
ncbi:MAG: sigma-70 family RNA polymerase sigma factor [Candidatus Omnitrophica bacterium]|nr:sigma-70 family RNA polymerase sigma factor [Candidatus Omnitrophota bacterium]